MSRDLNRVTLKGNVGREPEFRYLESGTKVARFSIATNDRYRTPNDESKEETEWHNVEALGVAADRVEALEITTGSRVLIEGRIKTDSWEKDGQKQKVYFTKIVILDIDLVAKVSKAKSSAESGAG